MQEGDGECSFDFVKVYDGASSSAPLVSTFCGNDNPGDITAAGNTVFVTFTSDIVQNGAGFRIQYTAKPQSTGTRGELMPSAGYSNGEWERGR